VQQAIQVMQQMQGSVAPQDPAVQAMMAETQRKAQADQAKAQIEQGRLQLDSQKMQVDQAEAAQKMQSAAQREVVKQDRLDQRQAAQLQVEMIKNREDNQTALDIASMEAVTGEKVGVSTGTGINP